MKDLMIHEHRSVHLFPVPVRLFEGTDEQGSGCGHHLYLCLTVLDGKLYSHLQHEGTVFIYSIHDTEREINTDF